MNIIINDYLDISLHQESPVSPGKNFFQNLLCCLGYNSNNVPVAELLRRFYELKGRWFIVSPVQWQATHNDAMVLADGVSLKLSDNDSRQLFAAFDAYVKEDNMSAYYCDANTWLLACDDKPDIFARPVPDILHRSILPELECLDPCQYWQRFLTEVQMYFNTLAFNRTDINHLAVNGVWVWGGGNLQSRSNVPVICGDENLLRLANLVSLQTSIFNTLSEVPKNAVLLFDTLPEALKEQLNNYRKARSISWYWSNASYQQVTGNWFSRLWRG